MFHIERRTKRIINTDPQRRCYNGCHYSSEEIWSPWETIDFNIEESRIKDRLDWWRDLNDYAISERGESARKEFRAIVD